VEIFQYPPVPPPLPFGLGGGKGKSGEFHVYRTNDIINKIIPVFDLHPLQGSKALDFADLRKAAEIIKVKGHLGKDGLEKILQIKGGMNKGRLI
jgi:hypothetical protein